MLSSLRRSDWHLCGGQIGLVLAVRPAAGRRSDRPYIFCEFGVGPKIEGVGKRGDSTTLGLIIFGASRQKFYWFENSSRFRISREKIWLSPSWAVRPAFGWRSDRQGERSDRPWWRSDRFSLVSSSFVAAMFES